MNRTIQILLVDDHPVFRKGLIGVLQSFPDLEVVHEADDGEMALELIAKGRPDVAILDVEMPRRNGLEVARELLKTRHPPAILFITAYKDEDMFNEAMNLGALGYVLKDSAVRDIQAGVRAVARGERFISPALTDFLFQRANAASKLARTAPGLESLTPAERRILKLIASNQTTKEIACTLQISPRTVENHRANIAAKLNLHGAHSLVKFAFDHKSRLVD